MAKKKTLWAKPGNKRKCEGNYIYVRGEREFRLTPVGGGKAMAFESPEAAKKDGWKKE